MQVKFTTQKIEKAAKDEVINSTYMSMIIKDSERSPKIIKDIKKFDLSSTNAVILIGIAKLITSNLYKNTSHL